MTAQAPASPLGGSPDSPATAAAEFVTAPSTPEPDALQVVVERRLGQHGDGGEAMTIFRVPAHVRAGSPELYEPRLVSIGPYYRVRPALRAMEQHKWRYLHEMLAVSRVPLDDYVGAVRDVERRARRCYSERTEIFDAGDGEDAQLPDGQSRRGDRPGPDDFAQMLLLDGCFILQLFSKWHNRERDELCDVGWGLALLHSDLLLLENQIPFFVLEALFRVRAPKAQRFHLRELIRPHLRLQDSTLFNQVSDDEAPAPSPQESEEVHHLLHLFYQAFVVVPRPAEPAAGTEAPGENRRTPPPMVVPSVTQLRDAGVRFERNPSPRHMFDVTFDPAAGVVRMPRVEVDHANKPLLVNLVAFEQSRGLRRGPGAAAAQPLSSYTALLGMLVRTGRDVERLQRVGIMDNLLDSDDAAATGFFQQLGSCSCLDYQNHLHAAMFADLADYYGSSWRRHKAKFLRDYCSSPCAAAAFAFAAFAFCFAVVKFWSVIALSIHHSR